MSNRSTLNLIFWVNTSRAKNNKASLYVRITVNGRRANISLNRKVDLLEWDSNKSKLKGKSEASRVFNRFLQHTRVQIFEAYDQLNKEKVFICAQSVKARFLGEDSKEETLLALIDYHNKQMSSTLSYGTLKNYFTTEKYVKIFLKKILRVDNIYLSKLTFRFLVDFEKFLRTNVPVDHNRKMENNTVMKHIQRLRKMVTLAYKMEWLEKDPFIKFKARYIRNEREFLSEHELETIIEKVFTGPGLQLVKDLFLFSCYTGLSYIDVMQLKNDNIGLGIDGGKWIITKRKKTNNHLKIPLLPIAEELIERYSNNAFLKNEDDLFPRISNQKMNVYLKEIAKECEINKNLTFHIARHTFATTITLCNGVPIETVSKLLEHTKISTTQIYARVIEEKVSLDMNILRNKLNDNLNRSKSVGKTIANFNSH